MPHPCRRPARSVAAITVAAVVALAGCADGGGGAKPAASAAVPAGPATALRAPGIGEVRAVVTAATSAEVYTTQRLGDTSLTGTTVRVTVGAEGAAEVERTFTREAVEMTGGNPDEALSMVRVRSVGGKHYLQGQAMDPAATSDWPKPWMRFDPAQGGVADSVHDALADGFRIPAAAVWPILLLVESPGSETARPASVGADDALVFRGTVTASDLARRDPAELGLTREALDRLVASLPGEEFLVELTTDGLGRPRRLLTQTDARAKDGTTARFATSVEFRRWNEGLGITAPAPDETFDAAELG